MADCERRKQVVVEEAEVRDIERIGEVLTAAFAADPVMRSMLVEHADPHALFSEYFRILLEEFYFPEGHIDVAKIDGRIVGAAMWQRNDVTLTGLPSVRFRSHMAAALGSSAPRMIRCEEYAEKFHPKFPHWYLAFIAVAGEARGHGVGGVMLDRGIAHANGAACYLESTTPASRALYERKGFVPLGIIDDGESVPCVGMWRPGIVRQVEIP